MLDLTRLTCPMTFVRTRLALDAIGPGAMLEILLAGEEPIRRVPLTIAELGHAIVAREAREDGTVWLRVRKSG